VKALRTSNSVVEDVRLPVKVEAEVEHTRFPTLQEALDQSLRQGGLARLTGSSDRMSVPQRNG
jgi:hypothetical protein